MKQSLIAIDQFVNCFAFVPGEGFGMADETISARLFRCHLQELISDRWYRAVDSIFGANHCFESWRSEIERRQLPGFYQVENNNNG